MSVVVLYVLCLGWGVLCGAIVYEHLCVIPQWVQQPPASLTMWRGPHRLRAERFWMSIHPVLLVVLGVALWLHWGDDLRRAMLLWVVGGYAAVIVATGAWYVPELMKLTRDPDADVMPPAVWRTRAQRWQLLCFPRSALCIALAIPILRALAST